MTSFPAPAPRRARLRYAALLALTVLILAVLIYNTRASFRHLARPDWPMVMWAGALTLLFLPCMALRWVATLWAGGYPVTFGEALGATMAVWPLGTLTPSKTGDLVKAFCIRHHAPLPAGLGSVVAERATDVVVLLALCLFGGMLLHKPVIVAFAATGITAAIGGWILIAREWALPVGPKWRERFAQFRLTWRAMVRRPQFFLLCAGASTVNWLLSIWQAQLLYRAYGIHVPFLFVCAALPVAVFVGLLPLTVAGMGTRDKTLMILFAPFAPQAASLSVGILYSLFGYLLPSLVGLFFIKRIGGKSEATGLACTNTDEHGQTRTNTDKHGHR